MILVSFSVTHENNYRPVKNEFCGFLAIAARCFFAFVEEIFGKFALSVLYISRDIQILEMNNCDTETRRNTELYISRKEC